METSGLKKLASYLPVVNSLTFSAENGMARLADQSGGTTVPFETYRAFEWAFLTDAYDYGWVLKDFKWSSWAKTIEAQQLRDDEAALATASAEQLMRLLTLCIRQDRFVDGALFDAFATGFIESIIRRAAVLVEAAP